MKVLITGTSRGIGLAVAKRFLDDGHEVIGLDLLPSSINHPHYQHYVCDIKKKNSLPNIEGINIIFNNAGLQNSKDDIDRTNEKPKNSITKQNLPVLFSNFVKK